MPPAVRVVGRDAHEPVDPGLALEVAERPLPFNLDGGTLDPGCLVGEDVDDPGLETLLLGPAQVHAQKHLGPVLGLEPSGAGMNLQKRAVGIITPGEDMGLLDCIEIFLEGGNGLLDVGRYRLLVFLVQFQQHLEVVPEGGDLLPAGRISVTGDFRPISRLCRVNRSRGQKLDSTLLPLFLEGLQRYLLHFRLSLRSVC